MKKKIVPGMLCRLVNDETIIDVFDQLTIWKDDRLIDLIAFQKSDVFFVTDAVLRKKCVYRLIVSHSVQGWIEERYIIALDN